MVGVRVDLRDWERLLDEIGITTEATKELVKPLAEELLTLLKRATPVDTGKMRDTWKMETIPLPGGLTGYIIKNDHPAVQFIEMGTRKHKIVPVTAKVLSFEVKIKRGKRKGETDVVFTKWVDHPGTRPRAFVRMTVRKFYKKYPHLEDVIQVVLVGNPKYKKQQTIIVRSQGWATR